MPLTQLRNKFDRLLRNLNGLTTANFSTVVENGYEALVLANVMTEYHRIHGQIARITHPVHPNFLNQNPGRFSLDRAFKVEFVSGESFFFATDVEVFGIEALNLNAPIGGVFEADVVVINERFVNDILQNYHGYPAPQHINSLYECKFGHYYKGQLRELLGLKRHISFLQGVDTNNRPNNPACIFRFEMRNSNPPILLFIVRPRALAFLTRTTSNLFDLDQLVIN